jgi:hypothetical protein
MDHKIFESGKQNIKSRMTISDGTSHTHLLIPEKVFNCISPDSWKDSQKKYSIVKILAHGVSHSQISNKDVLVLREPF